MNQDRGKYVEDEIFVYHPRDVVRVELSSMDLKYGMSQIIPTAPPTVSSVVRRRTS